MNLKFGTLNPTGKDRICGNSLCRSCDSASRKGSRPRVYDHGFTVKGIRLVVYGRKHQGTRRAPRVTRRVGGLSREPDEWMIVLGDSRSIWTIDLDYRLWLWLGLTWGYLWDCVKLIIWWLWAVEKEQRVGYVWHQLISSVFERWVFSPYQWV